MEIKKSQVLFRITTILLDIVLINLGYILAFIVKFGMNIPDENFIAYLRTWPWLTMSALALFYFYGLYGSYRWRWSEVFASLICVVLFQALVAMAFSYLFRGFSFPRTVLLTVPVVQLVLLGLWRRIAWVLEKKLQDVKKVIVVGQPLDAAILAGKLEIATGGILRVCGIVLESVTANEGSILSKITEHWPVLGEIPELCQWIDSVDPDQVFVCSNLSQEIKADVVNVCVAKDKKVGLVPDLYEIMLVQSRMEQVDDVPIFTVGRLAIAEESLIIKRMTDIILSLVALAAAAPFFALVTAAIKLDSKGPVFYRQKRLTLQGKAFYLFKFRTMIVDAELSSGPVLATENDPRITRVGSFLRAARIDEFPQLLNVLKGDMSIVGPRPERPFFVNELVKETPEYAYRMNVKSGITGLAQIAGRYSTSPENKLKYDLLYTKSYSPAKDIAILLQTLKVIMMKDKAS